MLDGWRKTALLVVATLLVPNALLVVGVHTGKWDASDFFCPYYTLIADHARQGQLLLWTPLVEGGCPAGVDPQIGALSPLTVALAALTGPHEFGFRCYWLLIWGLGGLGVLLLARHLAAPAWVGYLAAVGYMFSAIYTGHAEHTPHLVTMSLLPWCLWRLDVAFLQRRLRPAAEAGALWGLAALSGYPGLWIIGECYLALWLLGRFGGQKGVRTVFLQGRSVWFLARKKIVLTPFCRYIAKALAVVAVFLLVSLVVMSPVYVGFAVESRGYSGRGGYVPRDVAIHEDALHPKALSTWASPYLAILGSLQEPRLWPTDVSLCSIYVSPMLLGLALTGLWHRPRDGFRWFLAGLGLVCLAAALGDALPLRGWLYDLLPPMRYFRHSGIFRCYFVFTVVVLALLAGRDLEEALAGMARGFCRRWSVVALVTAIAAAASFIVICLAARPAAKQAPTLLLAAAHAALVWFGTALLAILSSRRRMTPLARRYLTALVIADALLTIVLMKPAMYANRKQVWSATEAAHSASLDLTGQGLARQFSWGLEGGPQNACLLAKVPVLKCHNSLSNDFLKRYFDLPVLARGALGPDRLWFSPATALAPAEFEALERLGARSSAVGGPCVVISDPGQFGVRPSAAASPQQPTSAQQAAAEKTAIEHLPAAQPLRATVLKYVDRELILDVSCPDDGWLLVTDRWAPGWRVWLNGEEAKLWIGNFVFRAVPVCRGANHLHFTYTPAGHPWLLWASWITLAAVAVAGAATILPRTR